MKITDALLGEHAVIYSLFDHVRETVLKSDDISVVHGAVATIKKLLVSHAKVEEELLFPTLEQQIGPMGPLAVMRAEHQSIDELVEAAGSETDIAAVKTLISQLLELAVGHFQKEERVLFAIAQQRLGDETLSELGIEWAAKRNVTIDGAGCMGAA